MKKSLLRQLLVLIMELLIFLLLLRSYVFQGETMKLREWSMSFLKKQFDSMIIGEYRHL